MKAIPPYKFEFNKYPATLLLVGLLFSGSLFAEIQLPSIFGSNMVLQQQTRAAIWGKASTNSTVRLTTSWDRKSYTTKAAADGRWSATVSTPVAGGPYEITISDGKEVKLTNVLIGEVWVCSGQSNMALHMKGGKNQPVLGSNEAIARSKNPNIRLITVTEKISLEPLDDFSGSWMTCEPESVSEFSATAYFFGRMLNEIMDVPVGLINTSAGGTRIEPWTGINELKKIDFVKLPDRQAVENMSRQTPTVLFNAMINPIVGYGIRGVIWYQGEANRNSPKQYEILMPALITNWRSEWGIGEFPFYYVQIAPYDYGRGSLNSAFMRESQLKASTALPNTGMACIVDVGEKDCIHPADKETVSKRLAYLALANTYGLKGFAAQSPVFREMEITNEVVNLTFDHAPTGLTSYGKELSCFEVAGPAKRFYPAKAYITATGIKLFSPSVPKPVAVRYAFKDFVVGDLFSTEGLPVSSFRSDDWDDIE
jgi:sialate O-acetylesterase